MSTGGRRIARGWLAGGAGLVVALACLGLASVAQAAAPTARFDMSAEVVEVGTTVTFTDRSTDPDPGAILRRGWDLNGDGLVGNPNGPAVITRTYAVPGEVTILLRVTDETGASDTATRVLRVVPVGQLPPPPSGNIPPIASFAFVPHVPGIGDGVSFVSTSSDVDGFLVKQLWDLDGDGQFDDAGGGAAQIAYATPGTRTVSLQVTDDDGASSVAFQSVGVTGPPASAPVIVASDPPTAAAGPRRLSPLPIVRMRGRVHKRMTKVDLLSVRAVHGAIVRVRCRGGGCRARWTTRRAPASTVSLRFRTIERRLAVGTRLEIFVTKAGWLGKYTRLVMRSGAAPRRMDRCLGPTVGASLPRACPTA